MCNDTAQIEKCTNAHDTEAFLDQEKSAVAFFLVAIFDSVWRLYDWFLYLVLFPTYPYLRSRDVCIYIYMHFMLDVFSGLGHLD